MNDATTQRQPRRSHGTRVREIMTRKVVTIQEHECVALAEQLMAQGGIRHLPVMRGEALVGLVGDRDILGLVSDGPLLDMPVRDVMAAPVETTGPDEGVDEASARMAARRIDCLPVLEDGRLVGILTSTDVLAERGRLAHKGAAGPTPLPLARDVMHRRVMTIRSDLPLREAIQVLVGSGQRHLPVVNEVGRAVGMFGDRELRASVGDAAAMLNGDDAALDVEGKVVSEVMRPGALTVPQDASVIEIADKILDERQMALCVLDTSERIVGIISYVDVLAALVGRKAREVKAP
ncbi:CBS domain-containing protein [Polyangium spumosum]|uniref:CBS domain-containing protein n=1 Tax=Polyangium spumosum TaxID=889282 RepID=A0A6N7PSY5_9BACT|nr:CBS domain-containing protein [Polyangium spumosum]MRG93154.1 CBS domain-containing protein [Polyangium spumosum]